VISPRNSWTSLWAFLIRSSRLAGAGRRRPFLLLLELLLRLLELALLRLQRILALRLR